MAQIFISYSRVDRPFVEALADKLRRIYGHDNVWFDEGLHGGDIWWEEILEQIASRDIFIYVLSNDSIESDYCQAEFTEARRLQKQIITVQARDRTRLTDELGDIHYIDMANGVDDADALTDLFRSVNKRMTKVPRRTPKPLWEPPTPRPGKLDEKPRPAGAPDVDTPTLEIPRAERENVRVENKPWWKKQEFVVGAILVPIIAAVLGAVIQNMDNDQSVSALPTTAIVQEQTDTPTNEPTERGTNTSIPSLSPTPTSSPSPTRTPTLSQTEVEGTIQAEMNAIVLADAQTADVNETATAEQERNYERGTAAALTLTATQWTPTPTIDTRATAEARLTETVVAAGITATANAEATSASADTATAEVQATNASAGTATANAEATSASADTATAEAQQTAQAALLSTASARQTATQAWIASWTDTPTPTNTATITPTTTNTPNATATLIAFRPQTNADWTPVERDFELPQGGTVTMVLVPAGCFNMGSDNGESDEQPVHEVCFDEPFWIDKYEVTNDQYGSVGCESWSSEPDQPRNCVDWFEASDFCEARNARLPTETEWEYAARGPDALVYPWGNEYNAALVIGEDDPTYGDTSTAPVGSRPGGASWVGALDMSGNLWEWTSSLKEDYPYDETDGREDLANRSYVRFLRGGSFLNFQYDLRAADRLVYDPDYVSLIVGFRCVRPPSL
jgi:formylglycine-generating enzyme required for sulfatase activity